MASPTTTDQWIPQPIVGGINAYDSDDSLGQGELVDSANFLFEGNRVFTRPGVAPHLMGGGITGRILFMKNFPFNLGLLNQFGVALTTNNEIWSIGVNNVDGTLTGTKATGPGITFVGPLNAKAVNSGIMIGGGANLIRWDPFANTYTLPTGAIYRYVTSHFGRAFAAVKTDSSAGFATTVGWSASGDATNWSTGDSGVQPLFDMVDEITGLGSIHNVIVILRNTGIHLGTLTGVAPPQGPVYRFEPFIRTGRGCWYPGTSAFADNFAFFVGEDDVYMFDLQQVVPIGKKIKDRLFPLLNEFYDSNNKMSYYGFVSRHRVPDINSTPSGSMRVRFRYHLIPSPQINAPLFPIQRKNYPHFVYDPQEDKWSTHTYNFVVGSGGEFGSPVLFDTVDPPTYYMWNPELQQEAGAFLLGPTTVVEQPEVDYNIDRVLLRYRNFGETPGIKNTVYAMRDNVLDSSQDEQIIGSVEHTGRWMRQYFNHRIKGQDVQWRIDVPPNAEFSTNYLSFKYCHDADFRGTV